MMLANKIQHYRTELLVTVIVALLLVVLDGLVNYPSVQYQPTQDKIDVPQWVKAESKGDALSEGQPLAQYFSSFEQSETTEEDIKEQTAGDKGLSEEAQKQQRGLLKQLYIGQYRYQLLAIVAEDNPTALLQKVDIETEQSSVVSLTPVDTLGIYKVKEITATTVTLVDSDDETRVIYLKLFVPTTTDEQ